MSSSSETSYDSDSSTESSEEEVKVIRRKHKKAKSEGQRRKKKVAKAKRKRKRELSDSDTDDNLTAKFHCTDTSKTLPSQTKGTVRSPEPVIQPAGGESEANKLMKLPSISTGKRVTMGADDFKSLMDFVRYVRKIRKIAT